MMGLKTGAIILMIFFAGLTGYSQPVQGRMVIKKHQPAVAQRQNYLNLTDDQKTKMKNLHMAQAKELLPLKNRMMELKAKYHSLITAEKADMKAIDANIDEQTKLINKIMKINADYRTKFSNVLTEEQRLLIQSRKGMMIKGAMRYRGYDGKGFHGKMNRPGNYRRGGWQGWDHPGFGNPPVLSK